MAKGKLFGAVVIGEQNVDLSIVDLRHLQVVERANARIALGNHLIAAGTIANASVEALIQALRGFQQLMQDYGVADMRVVASHTVTEATNMSYIRDQIYIRTGMIVHFMTINEELLLQYEGVALFFAPFQRLIQENTLLLHIGATTIDLMIFQKGALMLTRELPLGPLQVLQRLSGLEHQVAAYDQVLSDYLRSKLLDVWRLLPIEKLDQVILSGTITALFAPLLASDKQSKALSHAEFDQRFATLMTLSEQELATRLKLVEVEAAAVEPTLLLLDQIFDRLAVKQIWLTNVKMVDGYVAYLSQEQQLYPTSWQFDDAILTSAQQIARRYQVDEGHQQQVLIFAGQLFDRLKKIHGLTKSDRLLLQLAAILQDTGLFVDANHHALHSEYIIQESALLGLTKTQQQIVAAVARYHSASSPSLDLSQVERLHLTDRLKVAKLAAILRLADALDDSHQNKISKISLRLQPEQVVLTATADQDLTLEQWTFQQKADFFQKVYGLKPILRRKKVQL